MATILPFLAKPIQGAAQRGRSSLAYCNQPVDNYDLDDGLKLDDSGRLSLGRVVRLAAAPSQTLADMTEKVEVLVARLTDDEAGAGLCRAEVHLLTSVLHDLKAFAVISATAPLGSMHQGADAAAREYSHAVPAESAY
ncbi:hypothetical protein JMJ56_27055 [Belnapia sp. T18]|uniref:Uncharacterized protein n=1 Tax=Belnapia arida TaxID=2804533 RepID=A0ABS1UAD9_9PROT|nr:hypothetical protein [Belnapia arida]MBL6081653.1 hypothetical protein [Belnapia arida]